MAARTKARKRALDVLFESEMQGLAPGATLARRVAAASPPLSEYTISLVEGVVAHRERIDELLATYAVGWTLDRMPAVDRNLLRIGTYEILYRDDSVSLARELSTDDSPAFVNGLLGRILELKPTLAR